ncbi:MAG: histone deacetylase [Alphaproteobacteria bacterium]|nr:MAG: histone deacetylase [Alphaproteobacteria bacterium]
MVMDAMNLKNFIFNKAALRRITRIYIPCFVAIWLLLTGAAFMTEKSMSPLQLPQDFTGRLPIVYSDNYNIKFFGFEKLHPFDSVKYGEILDNLLAHQALKRNQLIEAAPPDDALMHLAHSDAYLQSLQSPWVLARIAELPFLRFFPARLARNVLLVPMMYQMGGSLLAAQAAMKTGWAVNLGGGFHHASYANGSGFCALADISLIVKYLRQEKQAQKFMIIDLDAHQGNGHETDFKGDDDVYIIDAYNKEIFPHDTAAKDGIDLKIELESFTSDTEYLDRLQKALDKAFVEFKPDLIIYNAGTDLLKGDPLGALDITPEGVIKRDEMVFGYALDRKVPIVMLLSGGYQRSTVQVISDSILNLKKKFKLF